MIKVNFHLCISMKLLLFKHKSSVILLNLNELNRSVLQIVRYDLDFLLLQKEMFINCFIRNKSEYEAASAAWSA